MLIVQQSQLVANRLERRQMDGREYAVAPAVLIKAGVLNNELVPVDEIAAFVEAWNGRPIPVRHPQKDGEYISANSPDVLEATVIGQVFNTTLDGDKLKGELWIDTAKAAKLGGDALKVLMQMDAGQTIELSTGYFRELEQTSGYYQGTYFEGIQRDLRPDHVALLPDEQGACSVADGCGAPRVNVAQGAKGMEDDMGDDGTNDYCQSVMVAFYLRAEDAQPLALAADALPGGNVLPANQLHVTLAYLGDIEDVAAEFNRVAMTLTGCCAQQMMVLASTCGMGRFANPTTGQDAVFLLVESEQLHQFRDWLVQMLCWDVEISRLHGFIPHITLGYVPSDAVVELAPVVPAQLVFDQVALSWGNQTLLFDLNGQLRDPEAGFAAMTANCGCSKGAIVEEKDMAKVTKKVAEEQGAGGKGDAESKQEAVPVVNAAPVVLPPELVELAALVKELGGATVVRDAVQSIQVNAARQKDDLVARLTANTRCAFSKDDLTAMSLEALAKLERSLRPTDYSARSGVVANAFEDDGEEWTEYVAPTGGEAKKS